MSAPRRAGAVGAALAVLLLAGCSGAPRSGSSDDQDAGVSADGSEMTEPAGAPAPEAGGPEAPAAGGDAKPAVHTVALPIGRQYGNDDTADASAEQCVPVGYLGDDDIPPGVRIRVTKASLDGPDVFRLGGSGCRGGVTACVGSGFVFTAENDGKDDGRCSVAVQTIGGGDGDSTDLSLTGELICPPGRDADCAAFAEKVAADSRTIPVYVLTPTEPTTSVPRTSTTASSSRAPNATTSGN